MNVISKGGKTFHGRVVTQVVTSQVVTVVRNLAHYAVSYLSRHITTRDVVILIIRTC
jgi:hypothetical protein